MHMGIHGSCTSTRKKNAMRTVAGWIQVSFTSSFFLFVSFKCKYVFSYLFFFLLQFSIECLESDWILINALLQDVEILSYYHIIIFWLVLKQNRTE